jgi:hypothetical protein
MQTRPLVLVGLALATQAGCQSYFPYGYGSAGPHSSFPPGTYAPQTSPGAAGRGAATLHGHPPAATGSLPPGSVTRVPPQGSRLPQRAGSSAGDKRVPTYSDPGAAAGGSAADDDPLKRPEHAHQSEDDGPRGAAADALRDESDDALSELGPESFRSPTPVQQVAGSVSDRGASRQPSSSTLSPYKYDPVNYSYLRGVVSRDDDGEGWRITYSREALDDDSYGGSMKLLHDDALDKLVEGDVVLVEGEVVRSPGALAGNAAYRISRVLRLRDPNQ